MPVKQQPMLQREKIAQLIQHGKEQGVVKPFCSPWASPVVLVSKRDGSTRFFVDYRRLNSVFVSVFLVLFCFVKTLIRRENCGDPYLITVLVCNSVDLLGSGLTGLSMQHPHVE